MQSKLSSNLIEGDINDPENKLIIEKIEGELQLYLQKHKSETMSSKNFM